MPQGQINHRHLFEIQNKNPIKWVCKTCRVNDTILTERSVNKTTKLVPMTVKCNYNNIIFSQNLSYYIQECQGPEVPIVLLINTSNDQIISVINNGSDLRSVFEIVDTPVSKLYEVYLRLFLT